MNARVEKILSLPAYQRMLIMLLTMALIAAVFYFMLYQRQLEEHGQLVTQRDAVQRTLQKNQKIANNLAVYREEYNKLKVKLSEALDELPLKKEIPALLTNIGTLAKEKGLDILRFKPAAEVPREFYAEVPVELKLTGSYHQAAAFFDAVSKMERIVNVQNLKMGGAKKVDAHTELAIDCRAMTFRFLENPPVPQEKGGKGK